MNEKITLHGMMADILVGLQDTTPGVESPPEQNGWLDIGDRMTNFDHSIDKETEQRLRKDKCYCGYTAWNFYGNVWFENDLFHCFVKHRRSHVATISAGSLSEIMTICSEKFGAD